MALASSDRTAPLPLPKRKRQGASYRTNLVTISNEKQLQLDWTGSNVPDVEAEDLVADSAHEEVPFADAAVTPSAHDVTRRAYPLAYDPQGPAGPALALLTEVDELARSITDAYSEGDIGTFGSRLAMIAALLAKAYPHTGFNPALGAAVSFLRRATLLADASQCGFEEIMALSKAARHIAENPLIPLEDSTDLVIELEAHGWVGADPEIEALAKALFGESPEAGSAAGAPEVVSKDEV
jgi:hypothetical protein